MATPQDRKPQATEVIPPKTGIDLPTSHSLEVVDGAADGRLAVGERLSGRYRIERELGEGGMGVVYLATDEQVAGEIFAVKVLKAALAPAASALLREEVRRTRRLSHPNIVDVHSVNIDGTRLYVLMEYLEGKSLRALLDEEFGRGMPFSRAAPIIEDACAALCYAHDHNVIHSDLKPANIFVTTSGRSKLLDFGIARVSRGPLIRVRPGSVLLTPAYASCEMLSGEEADRRDDIYSIACMIYEMLCGDRPFGRLNALEARAAGARVTPLGVLDRRQNRALARALAFDRIARTASIEELVAGLMTDKVYSGPRRTVFGAALFATIAGMSLAYLAVDKPWVSKDSVVVRAAAPDAEQPAISPRSIAVLPFLDLTFGREQRYIADAITTELIDRLTLFPGLSVTGQTSSFAVKDSKEDAPTLARRLRVEYLLEGTVRGSSDELRVTTRLIRAADGFELSSQVFERTGSKVLTLEDDIARAVAVDLHASLFNIAAPVTPSTRSLEAYRLLLQAEHLWQQDAATEDERVLIETALQKDPAYANAWVDLGYWWYDAMLYGKADTETALRNSRAAHERALALDKNSVGAHLGLAWLQMSQLDWTGAQRNIDRAGLLDPASLPLLTVRGEMARSAGRWGEAIRYEHERLQRDPLSVGAQFVLAESLLCAGEYQNAAEILGSTVTENPRYPGAHALLGRAIAAQGNATMALRFIDVEPDESMHLAGLAGVQFDLGNAKASDEALSQLKSQYGRTLPGLVGLAYAHRRELEPAFQWLQQAVDQRQAEFAANLACTPEPAFSALRADPRFAALRSSLGLNR